MTLNSWLTKDRSETDKNRILDRKILQEISVSNPALGINVYNNAIPSDLCEEIINMLEKNLDGSGPYVWQGARVTEADDVLETARKCLDFKISSKNLGPKNEANK